MQTQSRNFFKRMRKIPFIIIIIAIVAVAAVVYFFGSEILQFFPKGEKYISEKLAQDDVRILIAEIRIIGGVVEKVEKDIIFVHFLRQDTDKIYQVKVGPDTKLVKLDFNDPGSIPAQGKDAPDLPKISLSDIKKDDFVVAQASEDIKDKTEFIANIITLQIPAGVKEAEE